MQKKKKNISKIKKKEKPVLNSVQSLMKKKNDEVDDDD